MLHFQLMCPRCPASASSHEVERFPEILKEAQAEEPNHIECKGEVWVVRPEVNALEKGAPIMWRPSGKAFAWKDVEPEPLIINLPDASVLRLRFPLDNSEPIIEHGRPIGLCTTWTWTRRPIARATTAGATTAAHRRSTAWRTRSTGTAETERSRTSRPAPVSRGSRRLDSVCR